MDAIDGMTDVMDRSGWLDAGGAGRVEYSDGGRKIKPRTRVYWVFGVETSDN
jgi:hypothetical protein